MKQRIAFLYLNTGGGHVAFANALADYFTNVYSDTVEPVLLNGFSPRMKLCRFFFEEGYRLTSNFFEPGYVLFYQVTMYPFAIRFGNYFVSMHGERYLTRFLREQKITKVVCLHEVLTIVARTAINKVNPSIPLITILTDPFTAHALWFYQKDMDLVVFSEKLRKEGIERYGFPEDRIHRQFFPYAKAYEKNYTSDEIGEIKQRLGIPSGEKVLLIAGGGEGLKNSDRIVSRFIRRKQSGYLVVVCGRNRILKRFVTDMVTVSGVTNVKVYGFISFMSDLMHIADCVITKGGASTVMEVLAVAKPVIFSTFVRGQELGNVLYAVLHHAGWYITDPDAILDMVEKIYANPDITEEVKRCVKKLNIHNGLYGLADFLYHFPAKTVALDK